MEKLIWEAGSILIVLLSFTWAIYDTLKKFKQKAIISKKFEYEREKATYFKKRAELLKSQSINPEKPKDLKYSKKGEPLRVLSDTPKESKYSRQAEPENTEPLKSENDKSFAYLGGSAFTWSGDFVKSLEWKRFEEVCTELLKIQGYNAKMTSVGADGGIDIVIKDDNGLVISIAQCKAFDKKPIGVALIRELFGIMASENVKQGLFFTTSTFSNDAVEFAKNKNMKLIDLKAFMKSVNALSSDRQEWLYKVATKGDFTTPSCARCDVKMVKRVNSKNNSEFWSCPNFPKCRLTINVRA